MVAIKRLFGVVSSEKKLEKKMLLSSQFLVVGQMQENNIPCAKLAGQLDLVQLLLKILSFGLRQSRSSYHSFLYP
jgi:hypothetical protein